jgi:hypothetical protein
MPSAEAIEVVIAGGVSVIPAAWVATKRRARRYEACASSTRDLAISSICARSAPISAFEERPLD